MGKRGIQASKRTTRIVSAEKPPVYDEAHSGGPLEVTQWPALIRLDMI